MKISIENFSFIDATADHGNSVLQLEVAPRERGEEYILNWEYSDLCHQSFSGYGNVRELVQSISEKDWMAGGIPKNKIFEKVEKGVESLLVDEFKKLVPSYRREWYDGAFLEGFKIPNDGMSVIDHIKPETVSDFTRLSVLWVNYLSVKGEPSRSKDWEEKWVFFQYHGFGSNYPYWIRHFDENDGFHEYLPMEAVFVYPNEDYPIHQRVADAAAALDASIQKKDKFYKLDRYYATNCAKLLISLIHYSTVEDEVQDWSLLKFPKLYFSNLGNETDFFKKNVEMTIDQGIIVPDKTGKFLDISQPNKKNLLNLLKDDPIYFRSIIDQWSKLQFKNCDGVLIYDVDGYDYDVRIRSTTVTADDHKRILSNLEEIWCPMINRIRPEILQRINGRIMTVKGADFWIGRYGNRRSGTFKGILTVNKETFDCTLTNFSYLTGAEVTIADILSYLTEEEKENLESYLFKGEAPFSLYVDFSSKEKRGEDNFDDWSARTVIHFDHNETGSENAPESGYSWSDLGKPFMGKTTLKFNLAWMMLREEIWCALANSELRYFEVKKSCYRNKVMTKAVSKIKATIKKIEGVIIK